MTASSPGPRPTFRLLLAPGFVALAVWLLVVALRGAERPAPPERPDAAAVRAVLEAQVAAWNRGDLEAFMAGYWQSDALTFFSGKDRTQGWQATLKRYRKKYQADGKEMGQLSFSDLEVRLAGPDTAWVRGRWQVVTSRETVGGLFTLIFEKKAEGWRIVHDHTSG